MKENIIKGWVLSAIGLTGAVVIILHWTGLWVLPNPKALDTNTEAITGLLICGALFGLPKTKIDLWIEQALQFVIDKFTGKKQQ